MKKPRLTLKDWNTAYKEMKKEIEPDMKKLNKESKSFIPELIESVILVYKHFYDEGNTLEKTSAWFETPNPLLGNYKPFEMFVIGRGHKVLNFIKTSIDENTRIL